MFFSKKSLFFLFMIIGFISFSCDRSFAMSDSERDDFDFGTFSKNLPGLISSIKVSLEAFCREHKLDTKKRRKFLIRFTEKCFEEIFKVAGPQEKLSGYWYGRIIEIRTPNVFNKEPLKSVNESKLLEIAINIYLKYKMIISLLGHEVIPVSSFVDEVLRRLKVAI